MKNNVNWNRAKQNKNKATNKQNQPYNQTITVICFTINTSCLLLTQVVLIAAHTHTHEYDLDSVTLFSWNVVLSS